MSSILVNTALGGGIGAVAGLIASLVLPDEIKEDFGGLNPDNRVQAGTRSIIWIFTGTGATLGLALGLRGSLSSS